jgi:hypothetical protein
LSTWSIMNVFIKEHWQLSYFHIAITRSVEPIIIYIRWVLKKHNPYTRNQTVFICYAQENCLRNSNNISKKQQLRNNPTFGQNSGIYHSQIIFLFIFISQLDRLNHVDNLNDTADIPCEYCYQSIRWDDYRSHMVNSLATFYIYYFSLSSKFVRQNITHEYKNNHSWVLLLIL